MKIVSFSIVMCLMACDGFSYFPSGTLYTVDMSTLDKKKLPMDGIPVGANSAGGAFFMLSSSRQSRELQEIALDGTIRKSSPIGASFIASDDYTFALSPDAKLLAYLKGDDLHMFNLPSSTDEIALPGVARGLRNVGWLSNTDVLIELNGVGGSGPDQFVRMNSSTKTTDILYETSELCILNKGHMAISPDKQHFAFLEKRGPVTQNKPVLLVLNVERKEISDFGPALGNPCWSADSGAVAFIDADGCLAVCSLKDGATRQVCKPKGLLVKMIFVGNSHLVWMVEGGMGGDSQLIAYNLNSGKQDLISRKFGWDVLLPFGSEGKMIVREVSQ